MITSALEALLFPFLLATEQFLDTDNHITAKPTNSSPRKESPICTPRARNVVLLSPVGGRPAVLVARYVGNTFDSCAPADKADLSQLESPAYRKPGGHDGASSDDGREGVVTTYDGLRRCGSYAEASLG